MSVRRLRHDGSFLGPTFVFHIFRIVISDDDVATNCYFDKDYAIIQ